MQHAVFLYAEAPRLDLAAVRDRVTFLTNMPLRTEVDHDPNNLNLHHMAFVSMLDPVHDRVLTPMTRLGRLEHVPSSEDLAPELEQSRHSTGVRELVDAATFAIELKEITAAKSHQLRIALFHSLVQAIIEKTAPTAVVFGHSQLVITTGDYMDSAHGEHVARRGVINVRYHSVNGAPGEVVADTRGLDEIGLRDFQCHYQGLDHGKIGTLLARLGTYSVQHGTAIEDGNTVDGIEPDTTWSCTSGPALIGPDRTVTTVNPSA